MGLSREQILEERKKWYNLVYVQFEIIKCLHHRELCFLSAKSEEKKYPVRYLIAFSRPYLLKHFERFGFLKNLINMYHSVAVLKDIPVFSYNPKKRKEAYEYKEFNENYDKYVIGYNLFFDFDGKENFPKCLEEVKQLKDILSEYKLPIYILNSSFTGIHICIEAKYMPSYPINELLEILNNVAYNIRGIYSLETLDTSIIDLKRVQKLPFSYECSGAICLPLSDEMLKNFTPEMVKMKNVLHTIMIKNRGLLTRTWGLSFSELQANVLKFLNDFS